ncbi:MAG: ATP-binding cassette domain-containing protein [Clostridia bacterium]|nr:ATP-binding cassette domain-containing protein [Clostridia bacterium]
MTDVVVRDVTMRYGEQTVLSHFSHRFSAGRAHCVMGPSGCGKTTLLRLIAGLEAPESGEIEGVGKLGFLFQEDRLISHLTARKNVALVLTGRDADARAGAALEALGLADSMDKPVRELSGGMARRVAIARSVLFESELLLLDEPFRGLDEQMRAQAAAWAAAQTAGRTVIAVTHDRQDAELLNADVFEMKKHGERGGESGGILDSGVFGQAN